MIFESVIREALSPDPLEVAKDKVQTRKIAKVIAERRVMVHAALARAVPTEGQSDAGSRVAS